MDSVTQATLGAAVGEAVLGRRLGNKAIAWGAFFGSMPDFDVLLSPLMTPIQFLVYHRGISHSILITILTTPIWAWLFTKWYGRSKAETEPQKKISFARWNAFFGLVFATHIIIDCFNSYGTMVFEPFSDKRVGWGNLFVIDPLYTMPMLLALCICLFRKRDNPKRARPNLLGLSLSTLYVFWSFGAKAQVDEVFKASLQRQEIASTRWITSTTPLNTLLWYCIAETENGYLVGYYSLLDSDSNVEFKFIERGEEHLANWRGHYDVEKLIWFSDGYYCAEPGPDDSLLIRAMNLGRMPREDAEAVNFFTYQVTLGEDGVARALPYRVSNTPEPAELVDTLWKRIRGI